MPQEKKKEPADPIKRIQEFAYNENERKRKLDEEKKKKKGTIDTAPSDGIISRVYKYFTGEGKEKKK